MLSVAAATCLALAGCGSSSDDTSDASTTSTATTTAAKQPASKSNQTVAGDEKDALQNATRVNDGLKGLSKYVADFDEIAPVHAASGDVATTTGDAQTALAALGLVEGVLVFDSPAAAERERTGYKQAIETAKTRLGQVGKGSNLTADVDAAKQALDAITPAANALIQKYESISGQNP